MNLNSFIRDVPDFPKPGIIFKDITPLLENAEAMAFVTRNIADYFRDNKVTKIAGIDSRGFIFGSMVAQHLNIGFVPVRKKGKLPFSTFTESFSLEYGEDQLQIHTDALDYTDRVIIIDDLLATGGTARAALNLVKKTGATVLGLAFLIELCFLRGKSKFPNENIKSLIKYD